MTKDEFNPKFEGFNPDCSDSDSVKSEELLHDRSSEKCKPKEGETLTQAAMRLLKTSNRSSLVRSSKIPKQKLLTQEHKTMSDIVLRSRQEPRESERSLLTLFPETSAGFGADDMPYELRELAEKGFIKASTAYRVMSQALHPTTSVKAPEELHCFDDSFVFETGVFTQIEAKLIQEKRQRGSTSHKLEIAHRTNGQAKIEDFDEIDDETLTLIDRQLVLNESLGKLSQKLNSSQSAADMINTALKQRNSESKLDVANNILIDLEAFSSDEENGTKNLNTFSERCKQTDVNKKTEKDILDTKALENEFLGLNTQLTQNHKNLNRTSAKESVTSAPSFDKHDFVGFGKASGKDNGTNHRYPSMEKFNESSSGFASASGKTLLVKNDRLKKLEAEFFKEDEKLRREIENKSFQTPQKRLCLERSNFNVEVPMNAFGMAGGENVKIDENLKETVDTKALENEFLDLNTQLTQNHKNLNRTSAKEKSAILAPSIDKRNFVGFGMASGKAVEIDMRKINQIARAFDDSDRQFETKLQFHEKKIKATEEDEQIDMQLTSFSTDKMIDSGYPSIDKFRQNLTGFASASGKTLLVKNDRVKMLEAEFFKEDEKLRRELENKSFETPPKKLRLDASNSISEVSTNGFRMAGGKTVKIDENLKEPAENFMAQDAKILQLLGESYMPPTKKARIDRVQSPSSPQLLNFWKKGINHHSTPLISNDSRKLSNNRDSPSTVIASDIKEISTIVKKPIKTRLFRKFNDSSHQGSYSESSFDLQDFEAVVDENSSKPEVTDIVKIQRKQSLEKQKAYIKMKPQSDRSPMAGSVYLKKTEKNRTTLRQFLHDAEPEHLQRHDINLRNASHYKFPMRCFVDEATCRTNTEGILVADNFRLIINELGTVGLKEIKTCFLESRGVDPALASAKWIENSYKMIVLKLSWLENSFKKFEKFELLNPKNVLLQMKYRYDREQDQSNRSAIKKIVELDEVSCRRMVLKVAEIFDSPMTGCMELFLTDGWYVIAAKIDLGLVKATEQKKIIVGTKLMTSYAELEGCGGFDPLDMPSSVKLKIHANSTRRVSWDTRMGFTKNPWPFLIALDSIVESGGVIGKLKCIVTHVYPLVYVDSSSNKKEFRSEKLQQKYQNKLAILNSSNYDAAVREVERETMTSLRERAKKLKLSYLDFDELEPEQICDILDYDNDSELEACVFKDISEKTMLQISAIRENRRQEFNKAVQDKLGQKENNLSVLLKFRVVNATNPRRTALVSLWSPKEELLEAIKEGITVEILNSFAGPSDNEIRINCGKSAVVRKLQTDENLEKISTYLRKETCIRDICPRFSPQQNELDIACVIIHLEPPDRKEHQKVYVADEFMNVVCINFWSSLKEDAFDEVVFERNIVYIRNLQWRPSHSSCNVPQAFVVAETTQFSAHPKQKIHQTRLSQLKTEIKDLAEFVVKCKSKISKLVPLKASLNKKTQAHSSKYNKPLQATPPTLMRSFGSKSSYKGSKRNQVSTPKTSKSFSRSLNRPTFNK